MAAAWLAFLAATSNDRCHPEPTTRSRESPDMNQDDKSDAWKKGYAARSKVLGEAYVEKAFVDADDLTNARRARFVEVDVHLRGALRNGVTRAEIKEILLHTAVYCGAPAALDSFRIARKVFAEQDPA